MNGVVIRMNPSRSKEPGSGDGTEATGACFARLFSSILEDVAKLHWITLHYESSPFASGMADTGIWRRVEELRIDVEGVNTDHGVQLYSPPALRELARYVRNDWQDFLGVKRSRDPLAATRRFVGLDERADFGSSEWTADFTAAVEEETELVFFANDAGVWEVYAAESSLRDAVLNACRELDGGIRVRAADLGQRDVVLSERW